jgi:hypothetical protein
VNVTGYLRNTIRRGLGSGTLEILRYSIVDDLGNEINLSNIDSSKSTFFTMNRTTDSIYSVEGNFRTFYDGFELIVSKISTGERPIITTQKIIEIGNCAEGNRIFNGQCVLIVSCDDGSLEPECSANRPYICENGKLIPKATTCGCPYDYRVKGNDCELILRCSDRTVYGDCSTDKPLYCLNGSLIKKASSCGCPLNEVVQGDDCVSKYETAPKEQTFSYVVKGDSNNIKFTVYAGLKDYLAGLPRYFYCDPACPSDRELELRFLDQNEQKKYLINLVEIIKSQTSNSDEQARIAVSLVQKIPYDWEGFRTNDLNDRYPYEVLYDNKGVCGEKARLLAFILRDLGFGIVLFNYETESHMAVGIRCPSQYSYENSSYCFIEAAAPSIITDAERDYVGVGKLSSTPSMISINDGKSFDSVSEEYNDVQEWNRINKLSESSGGTLDSYNYYKWQTLVNKYGIELTEK